MGDAADTAMVARTKSTASGGVSRQPKVAAQQSTQQELAPRAKVLAR